MQIFLVLPAYNESENLGRLLEKLTRIPEISAHLKVIVVNDGSTDDTAKIAETFFSLLREKKGESDFELFIETHPQNLGLGAALRTGLSKALSMAQPEDSIALMDADDSHPPELLPQMEQKITQGFDGVIASRYLSASGEIGISLPRKFLSLACNKILQLFFPVPGVKDYTCGYRLLRASLLKKLQEETAGKFFSENGFVATSELLLRLHQCGAKFFEVPFQLRYDLKKGKSKMKIFRTIFGYFRLIWRKRLRPEYGLMQRRRNS